MGWFAVMRETAPSEWEEVCRFEADDAHGVSKKIGEVSEAQAGVYVAVQSVAPEVAAPVGPAHRKTKHK